MYRKHQIPKQFKTLIKRSNYRKTWSSHQILNKHNKILKRQSKDKNELAFDSTKNNPCLTFSPQLVENAETEPTLQWAHQSPFLRKEHPSVSLARPPVGWQSTVWQLPHTTTVWEWLNTVVLSTHKHKQPITQINKKHELVSHDQFIYFPKTQINSITRNWNLHVKAALTFHILQSQPINNQQKGRDKV